MLGSKEIMAKNIRKYMERSGVSPSNVCADLGFPLPTFSDWIHAKTYPRIDKIEMMANYFGCKKSDLVEDWENSNQNASYYIDAATAKKAQEIFSNKDLALLFDAAIDASPEDIQTVHQMLLALKRKEARGNTNDI